ncbi:MAG TPA: metalloregulator ArsR/SmtB family transcription factor [Planctomycetaceae bacterium]|nr:metalloregulator ArsR/SmtB family transcription factor [Planctomycetaceae bacterium]
MLLIPFCGGRPFVPKDPLQPERCAEQLKALSEPLRLRIVTQLRTGAKSVGQLAELLDVEMVTVSHHLQILRHAHLVKTQRRGRFVLYRLHEDVFRPSETSKGCEHLDLGCCRLELPKS